MTRPGACRSSPPRTGLPADALPEARRSSGKPGLEDVRRPGPRLPAATEPGRRVSASVRPQAGLACVCVVASPTDGWRPNASAIASSVATRSGRPSSRSPSRSPSTSTVGPTWLFPAVEAGLLVVLVIVASARATTRSARRRRYGLAVIGLVSLTNVVSLGLLVHYLVNGGTAGEHRLIESGMVLWLWNVLLFAVWYWEMDGGGPVARFHNLNELRDFQFPQMENPRLAPQGWPSPPSSRTTVPIVSPAPISNLRSDARPRPTPRSHRRLLPSARAANLRLSPAGVAQSVRAVES